MNYFTTVLLFFIFGLSTAQSINLKGTIQNADASCNTDKKFFKVVAKEKALESANTSWVDSNCNISKSLRLPKGAYKLNIQSIFGLSFTYSFIVSEESSQTIDFGTATLKEKVNDLEEVTITGVQKKFIQMDAEKTIITVENNAAMEAGSVYDAILKIPGIIPAPNGGFTYSGQFASILFEGIPSNLSGTDLDNLLRSLPATSVKKIELVTNPGASYDANFTGAVIDIISNGRTFKWLSGTASLSVGLNENFKCLPNVMLNGKVKKVTWSVQGNYSFYEREVRKKNQRIYLLNDTLKPQLLSENKEKNFFQNYSFRGNMTMRVGKQGVLQTNLGYSFYDSKSKGNSGISSDNALFQAFKSNYESKAKSQNIDAGLKFRQIIDTFNRKIEISTNFSAGNGNNWRGNDEESTIHRYAYIKSNYASKRSISRIDVELPLKNKTTQFNLGVKTAFFFNSNLGSYLFADSVQPDVKNVNFDSSLPFNYREQNLALYTEFKQKIKKKIFVTLGLRAEDFRIFGKTNDSLVVKNVIQNLFPSIHTLYKISDEIVFTLNYSRKINMPYASMYDPNYSGYYDSYTQSSGNTQLKPNFSHRSHAKLAIFDYLQLSVTHNYSKSINLSQVLVDTNTFAINYSYKTYSDVQSISGFFSLPLPFGIFKHGLNYFQQEIDIDEISFMYLYADVEKTFIPNYDYMVPNKARWTIGFYSQFILPWKIRLNVEYNYLTKGFSENIQYTRSMHLLEAVLSREFFKDTWRVSLSVQDILNNEREVYTMRFNQMNNQTNSKWDTRVCWLKIAYSFGRYEKPSLKEDAIPNLGD